MSHKYKVGDILVAKPDMPNLFQKVEIIEIWINKNNLNFYKYVVLAGTSEFSFGNGYKSAWPEVSFDTYYIKVIDAAKIYREILNEPQ